MRLALCLLFFILVLNSCSQVTSRAEYQNQRNGNEEKRDERVLVSHQENSKYGLSILFYKDESHPLPNFAKSENIPNVMVFRDDKSGSEFCTVELADGKFVKTNLPQMWSPDNEFMISYCDNHRKMCVYKASEVSTSLAQKNILDETTSTDFLGPITFNYHKKIKSSEIADFVFVFQKWEGENTFVFEAAASGESKDRPIVFKYNTERKKVYQVYTNFNTGLEGTTEKLDGYEFMSKKDKF